VAAKGDRVGFTERGEAMLDRIVVAMRRSAAEP